MKRSNRFCGLVLAALACSAGFAPHPAQAQEYPTRTLRLVVPFPAGGAADILGRLLGQKLSDSLGKPVIVENRAGSNTIVAAELVARSAPDGHTLLLAVDTTLAMNKGLYKKLSYDPAKDFAPISLLGQQPLLMSTSPKTALLSLREFIDYAKANPGKLNVGYGSVSAQVAAELIKLEAGISFVVVPYAGSAPSRQALLAGDVQAIIGEVVSPLPFLKDGRMRALGVTGSVRAKSLPDVPSISEAGYPAYDIRSWYALVTTAGTPASVVAKLNAETVQALQSSELRTRLGDLGLELTPTSPEQLARFIGSEIEKWDKLIARTGVRIE